MTLYHSVSNRTKELLSAYLLGVIDPEEVRVQDGLDDSGDDGDGICVLFRKVPVNPIRNIQRAIRAEGEEIVSSNCLGFACSLQHEKLWQDCDGLKPD